MGCGCRKAKRYEVISASGAVLYSTDSRSTAESVSRRYEGSAVKEKVPSK